MRRTSPGLAIARQLWWRHRREAFAALILWLALVAVAPPLFGWVALPYAIAGSLLPLIGVFGFFMNALLFVDHVGNFTSGYPRRMFTLPVPSRTLVIWPMLYASAIVAFLWVVTASLIYRPLGFHTPLVLPALGLAALMAWFQAISWSPLRPVWLRLVAAIGVVGVLGGIALGLLHDWIRLHGIFPHAAVGAILMVLLAAAYPLALAGVASDRMGEAWRVWPEGPRVPLLRQASRSERRPFRSPAQAQLWYEWRNHGLLLPIAVAGILVLLIATSAVAAQADGARTLDNLLILVLTMPIWLAGSVGIVVARFTPFWIKDQGAAIPFLAIRPISSNRLVAAKWKAAALSALAAWVVTLVTASVVELAVNHFGTLSDLWHDWHARFPGGRALAVLALGAYLMPVLLWKQLTDFTPMGLSGRPWIEGVTSILVTIPLMMVVAALIWFPLHPRDLPRFLATLPLLVTLGITLKLAVASWAFNAALRQGLMARRDVAAILTAWLVVVASAVGLAALALTLTLPATTSAATWAAVMAGIAALVPLSRFPRSAAGARVEPASIEPDRGKTGYGTLT